MDYYLQRLKHKIPIQGICLLMVLSLITGSAFAQTRTVTGTVIDSENEEGLPGVNIIQKGTSNGTISDINGAYSLSLLEDAENALIFSSVGYTSQEFVIGTQTVIDIQLTPDIAQLEEIVIVGYGEQKKESVVGAITQAKGEELLQAGGVTNVGEALQGRLPGVTTIYSNGLPGESDPQIFIRGQSSWNGSGQPLILVDGIERPMNNIDLTEIDRISVLKDASATAVYGVKGANGVILITTKRGSAGKAELNISANSTLKTYSKLPEKLSSFDGVMVGNEAIMRELMYQPTAWNDYVPMEIADKYRNPLTPEESFIYPNVDWTDQILRDYAWDHRVNLSVRGGTDFAKYFGSLSYQSVSDLFKGSEYPNGKGYMGEYQYNRFNYRSNLDFNITKTTKFSVNLSGFYGIQEKPIEDLRLVLNAIYEMAPSLYTPVYPDGFYGIHPSGEFSFENPIVKITNTGYNTYNQFQVNSDFVLEQKLDFITQGLSFRGSLSYDNNMTSRQRLLDNEIESIENVIYRMYDIDGNESIFSPPGLNDFDFVVQPWRLESPQVQDFTRVRRLNYQLSMNYNRTFASKHNVSALFLLLREEYARGNMFPRFREDWVGRLTYNYDSKYFIDINGAYNGSEKFGPGYRFDLFPSFAAGWMLSNESFMDQYGWLDMLKIKGSYGVVGDDNFNGRWKYQTQWGTGGQAYLVNSDFRSQSPYVWNSEDVVGNPDLQWETAVKSNIGTELSVFNGLFGFEFDYFMEDRDNVLIVGNDRSVPDFYGTAPPDFNSGAVEVRGYELVLDFSHKLNNGINLWANFAYTDAKDKVIAREDPELRPFYLKNEGYPIGQTRAAIPGQILTSWDDIYMATPRLDDQNYRRPGYYDLVDYDIDGVYNGVFDNAPYGYPVRPQKTWTFTGGAGFKGVNVMVQFYGTQNATRYYDTRNLVKRTPIFYEHTMGYWSVDNPNSETTLDSWSLGQADDDPHRNLFDASVLRLKTVELAYNIPKTICSKMGIRGLRVFTNANNLYLWTDMPDDREFNGGNVQESGYRGDYPTMKRFNFGLNLNF